MYFKITNQEENHYGLQYQDGIVEDILAFNNNPLDTCCEGGIYFSDEKHILKYIDYGPWIRQVEISEDAQWLPDPNGNKWRASKLFFHPRRELFTIETIKWMEENGIDIHGHTFILFIRAAENGYLELVKYLLSKGADIEALEGGALRCAANNGKLEVVKFLVEQGADVSSYTYAPIRWASYHGHLDVAQFLFKQVKTDIDLQDGNIITYAVENNNLDVVKWAIANGSKYIDKALNAAKKYTHCENIVNYLESVIKK